MRLLGIMAMFMTIQGHCALFARDTSVDLTIHLRGVYESRISLLALNESGLFKPVVEIPGVKNGAVARLSVPEKYLPGEFVLRFEYSEKEGSEPYPSEKVCFISSQPWELFVNPVYCNSDDSTWFGKGELENNAYRDFTSQVARRKDMPGLLQNFLLHYDDTGSDFYLAAVKEYGRRREEFNQWLAGRMEQDKGLFVSVLYAFQYIPDIPWGASEKDRLNSMIDHYFDGISFDDPRVIKTSYPRKWMDTYVNMYGSQVTSVALRDSLFPLAGQRAVKQAAKGDPLVYGWMVDYFYKGYETNGMDAGIRILQPYLDDPRCLTSKRTEINRRLKGIETLVPGSAAPEISLFQRNGLQFELGKFLPGTPYILLFFWASSCNHCTEMADRIYPWSLQPEVKGKVTVVAISLDDTETDIRSWEKKSEGLKGWIHMNAPEGVRSQVAADYFILSTPVMILIDSGSKKVTGLPGTFSELERLNRKN